MVLVTHLYRNFAHRRDWTALPLLQLLPRVTFAWFCLLALYNLEAFVMYVLRWGPGGYFDNLVCLGALTGGIRYMAIWLLAFHGYHFARRSAEEAARAARNAQLATEAQLAKLTSELNPHFLFNSLNGIKALTREDPARARLVIDRLAELLRYSLRQSEREVVPLSEEVHIIREYLALEGMRLEERLTVGWDLPEDLTGYALPPAQSPRLGGKRGQARYQP